MLRYLSRLPLFRPLVGDRGPGDLERRPRSRGSRCLRRSDGLNDLLLLLRRRFLGDFDRELLLLDLELDSFDDDVELLAMKMDKITDSLHK